jgi:hypothetical protein
MIIYQHMYVISFLNQCICRKKIEPLVLINRRLWVRFWKNVVWVGNKTANSTWISQNVYVFLPWLATALPL